MIQYHEGFLGFEPNNIPIAHCIGNDRALGAGFAAQVPDCHRNEIRAMKAVEIGSWYRSTWDGLTIYHLVTKETSDIKPTWDDFEKTLTAFGNLASATLLKNIRCPRIGSGLDRLPWNRIEKLLISLPMTFHVYTPKEPIDVFQSQQFQKVPRSARFDSELPLGIAA